MGIWIILDLLSILTLTFNMILLVLSVLKNYEKRLDVTTSSISYQTLFLPLYEGFLYFALYVETYNRDPRLEIRHAVNPRRF